MMAEQKHSVEWHKACLKNHGLRIQGLRRERKRLNETIQRSEEEFDFLQSQIAQAEAEGLQEFDPDTYWLKDEAN